MSCETFSLFLFFLLGGGGFTRLFSMLLCWFLVLLALHCDHVPTYSLGIHLVCTKKGK